MNHREKKLRRLELKNVYCRNLGLQTSSKTVFHLLG